MPEPYFISEVRTVAGAARPSQLSERRDHDHRHRRYCPHPPLPKARSQKLTALRTEHGLSEESARAALALNDRSTPEGRRADESAEVLAEQVNRAESDLTQASIADLEHLEAATFARFG